jgi:abequosyltransferase
MVDASAQFAVDGERSEHSGQPLVSICIATYNRGAFIGETLDSIIGQITNGVEVLVVDGASTDDTPAIVEAYARRCPQLRYIRLPAKGGVDQDYSRAVEYAQGKMCWLFTDDDLMAAGAIADVLEQARRDYSLIVVNAEVKDATLVGTVAESLLPIKSDTILEPGDLSALFGTAIQILSFIGCVVIDRALWLRRDKATYFGTEFVHVGVIFQAPLPGRVLLMADPRIVIRFGNAQWSRRAVEIWMVKWPRLLASFSTVSPSMTHAYREPPLLQRTKTLLVHRSRGEYSLAEYRRWFAGPDDSRWRVVALAVAFLPQSLVRATVGAYLRIFNRGGHRWLFAGRS